MKIEIHFTNKQILDLVMGLIIVATAGYVYSAVPNPGHSWNDIDFTGVGACSNICTDADTDTNTYCSASGNKITCPDGTSLTDTDTNTWRPATTPLYKITAAGCSALSAITLSSTCSTACCQAGRCSEGYKRCDGSCDASRHSSYSCPNTLLGYLVSG